MGDGKVFALLCVQIIFVMGIAGEDDGLARFFGLHDFFGHARDDGKRFFGAKRAGNKVLLHVHNDKNVHDRCLL